MIPLKDTIPSQTFPFVNILLILANSLIFLFEVSLSPAELQSLLHTFGVIPARFFATSGNGPENLLARYFPLFTSMFLHGGWFHVIGNMWYLWIFGDNVEDRMGHIRYFLFYILCGLGAGLAQTYFNPASTVPTIGASGAIAGVMGAYMVSFPRARVITLVFIIFFIDIIEIPAFFFLGIWVFMQFLQGTASLMAPANLGGVAWWAHIGGFVMGAVLVFFFRKSKGKAPRFYPDQYSPW